MNRRQFISSGVGALATLGMASRDGQAEAGPSSKPNVIVILPDEWRGQALGCMGNPDVQTPNLDRLASEGMLFENNFANTPVCCPARASILTGKYASQHGMVANDLRLKQEEVTLGDLFTQAGYQTGYVGKWHLDGGPRLPGFVPPGWRRHGFKYWAANECTQNYFYSWYFRDANEPIIVTSYEPTYWVDEAIQFVRQSQTEPFFLVLSTSAPHDPYRAPLEYVRRYNPQKIHLRPNYVAGTRGANRVDIATYYASLTAIDDPIGRLLATLRDLKLEENTIVFFISDHGNMLGSHGKILKRKPWEESIRVPGIMRWPGKIPAGRKTDVLLSDVDFGPTLLSLCGIDIPKWMPGTDQSRAARGETDAGPESVYFQIFGPYDHTNPSVWVAGAWRGVRTERYMYARWQAKPWVLYDLERDPYELKNLVDDPSSASLLKHMDRKLADWGDRIDDQWSLDWTAPVEDGARLYEYRTFYTVDEYLKWASAHPNLSPTWGS